MYIKLFWRIFLLFLVTITFSACTTMREIEPTPTEVTRHFEKGDVIKVHTTDGTTITFKVVDITEEAIVGTRETIPFKEIAKIEKKKISATKTAAVGGVTVLSVYGTLIITFLVMFFSSCC
jgi:hypothetical protein